MSFDERFSQMTQFRQTFGFLFNIHTFKGINSDNSKAAELKIHCLSLQQVYSKKGDGTDDDESDVDGQ